MGRHGSAISVFSVVPPLSHALAPRSQCADQLTERDTFDSRWVRRQPKRGVSNVDNAVVIVVVVVGVADVIVFAVADDGLDDGGIEF